jgi:outer membrane protein OmpA-like peptidoglycan-associated protein
MINKILNRSNEQEESHWLSVSDLMAGLMMVFLFIAIALMRNAFIERDKIKEIAVAYQENQVSIYEALKNEFINDLPRWNAEIDEDTLTFTFKAPDVLFESGEVDLSPKYKELLTDFFPRYMEVLEPFHNSINEIRIEGHTSSDWQNATGKDAYFNNMRLSQGRTRAVLNFIYELPSSTPYLEWIKSSIAAVGLSSSRLVINKEGDEDKEKSRRVSFRVITNADIQIKRILQESS